MASASQHARHTRYDLHRLDAAEKLASGALRVPARVARVGVLDYTDADGNQWGELVPEETLFSADSMATLRAVALTDLHPSTLVTPESRKGLQIGHVGDVIAQDGPYLSAPVYVTDASAIKLVQSGERRDVSCGYTCDLDETPGTHEGRPYRAIQRARVYNHLGLGPEGWGRAGSDVGLRLDGADETAESGRRAPVARLDAADSQTAPAGVQEPAQGAQKTSADSQTTGRAAATTAPAKGAHRSAMAQPNSKTTRKDGDEPTEMDPKKDAPKKDAEPGDEMVPKKDMDAAAATNTATIASLKALLAEANKRVAELEGEVAEPVMEEDVPEPVADSIVAKRLATLDSARVEARLIAPAVVLETRTDGGATKPILKVRDIHEAALKIAAPTFKCDGRTDDAVAGAFAVALEAAKERGAKADSKGNRQDSRTVRNDALANAHRVAADPNATDDSVEASIAKMRADSRDAWRTSKPALSVSTTIKAD